MTTIVRSAACRRAFALGRALPAATFVFALTQASPCAASTDIVNSNTTPIVMAIDADAATPYPSVINVSGIGANVTTKVQVTLNNFNHSWPDDVDILLEAPDGTRSIVMSDSGGSPPISGKYLTFSPTATLPVPGDSPISDAVPLRPTNGVSSDQDNTLNDYFPAPGPGNVVSAVADFDAFNGINPNGAWKLYVVDDYSPEDGGAIQGGWTLILTTPSIYTVTKTEDTNDGTCDSDCSLREAIAAAGNGDLIQFGTLFDNAQTITLDGTQLSISASVTIEGRGADRLSISGNFASRVFSTVNGLAVTLKGMTIRDGVADVGGGMLSSGQLTLTDVAFTGNKTEGAGQGFGGGLYLTANGNITGSTFSDNRGGLGGAIFFANAAAPLHLANVTLSDNRGDVGAALYVLSSNASSVGVEIVNATIANNIGNADVGGIQISTQGDPNATAAVTLRNSIVANNSGGNFALVSSGGGPATIQSLGFNLTNDAINPDFTAATDLLGVDPKLGPLNNNGGHVETLALLGGSPALDAGHSSGYANDQRGQSRSYGAYVATPPGDYSDIGAAEMHAVFVKTTADGGAGSLRIAMGTANINGAGQDDILFDPIVFGTPQTINLASALPEIGTSLSINGPGAKLLTVRRDTGGNYRIFSALATGLELALSGLTISNGVDSAGGGLATYSRLSVAQAAFTGNADAAPYGGGGLALFYADGTIKQSTFSGNSSIGGSGGGILFQAAGSVLRVASTTISGNAAAYGGGIAIANLDGGLTLVDLANSTIANNTAPFNGGVDVYAQGNDPTLATLRLRNSIVARNTLPNLGAESATGGTASIVSLGYNLTDDPTPQYLDQPTDQFDTDPLLRPLADNGGPTKTHALKPGSPALDGGDRSGSNRDQRGYLRGYDQPAVTNVADGSDIGALEQDDTLFRDGFDG